MMPLHVQQTSIHGFFYPSRRPGESLSNFSF